MEFTIYHDILEKKVEAYRERYLDYMTIFFIFIYTTLSALAISLYVNVFKVKTDDLIIVFCVVYAMFAVPIIFCVIPKMTEKFLGKRLMTPLDMNDTKLRKKLSRIVLKNGTVYARYKTKEEKIIYIVQDKSYSRYKEIQAFMEENGIYLENFATLRDPVLAKAIIKEYEAELSANIEKAVDEFLDSLILSNKTMDEITLKVNNFVGNSLNKNILKK